MRCGPLSMGSCSSEILDETHCFWVMCPHPCCWEAEQRVARGIARRIESRTPVRNRALLEEEFPTLKVVNVSEWAKSSKPPKKKLLYRAFSSGSCHSITSQSQLSSHSPNQRDSGVRLEGGRDLHFPELNSAAESPHSTNNKHSQDVKLSQAQISPLDCSSGASYGSVSMVIWMSNPQRVPHSPTHHRRKSPHVAVKDLTCVPSSQLYKIPKPASVKKSRDVKKTERLQLACTQMSSPNGKSYAPETRGELAAVWKRGGIRESELVAEPEAVPRPVPAARGPSACLRNRPAIFHSARERGPPRAPSQHAQYRLDSENGAEGIDWLRLRSQTYLWKKHNLRQDWDRDTPAFPPPQPPQHWAGTHPISKATLHHHHRGALAIGPALCHCVECVEEVRASGGDRAMGSQVKCSTAAISDLPHHSALHQPLSAGNISGRKPNSRNTTGPYNSSLHLMNTALQGSLESEGGTAVRRAVRAQGEF
ncbi:hypothetical protein AAFF_G00130380 [Aldrovandia affinis]|uniref:Uncharacterized protein n=1 Tax=Aldrovandia affinis TaxID=143900 RepID=A0AAD7RRE9_9TELE|nr:hypothetical protein AAFF_G00130380 [Aldrovandia affinis]